MHVLTVQNVTVAAEDTPIVSDISFTLDERSITGLIGPNGAGKSTLVRVIIGALRPQQGAVRVAASVRMAYIPQLAPDDLHALPLSVCEFMAIATKARFPWDAHRYHDAMRAALARVDISATRLDQDMRSLSGGERQRVLLARALLRKPTMLVLDEPFSAVDFHTRTELYELLKTMRTELSMTILLVSHDIESVMETCDTVLCLNRTLAHGCHPVAFMRRDETLHAMHHHS